MTSVKVNGLIPGYKFRISRTFGFIIVSATYVALNLIAMLSSSAEFSWDSDRYFSTIFDPQNPGFITSLVFYVVGDHSGIMFALVAISSTVWLFLFWGIAIGLRGLRYGWTLGIAILLISLSTPLWSWHTVLLSESLTTSAVVLWIGTIVWLVSSRTRLSAVLVGSTLATLLVIASRPQLLIVFIPLQIIVLVSLRKKISFRLAILNGAVLIAAVGIGVIRLYQFMASGSFQYLYVLHNFIDKSASFRPYALEVMPRCEPLEQALAGPAPWPDTLTLGGNLIPVCPETWLWFNSDAAQFPAWFLEIPAATLSEFISVIRNLIFYPMSFGQVLPSWLSDALLNPQHLWLWTIAYATVGIGAGVLLRGTIKITFLNIVSFAVIIGSATIFTFVVWGADGYDLSRHVYPVVPFLGIGALAILPVAAWTSRTPTRNVT